MRCKGRFGWDPGPQATPAFYIWFIVLILASTCLFYFLEIYWSWAVVNITYLKYNWAIPLWLVCIAACIRCCSSFSERWWSSWPYGRSQLSSVFAEFLRFFSFNYLKSDFANYFILYLAIKNLKISLKVWKLKLNIQNFVGNSYFSGVTMASLFVLQSVDC